MIQHINTAIRESTCINVGYRTKLYSDIWYNVDIGRSDIRLSPISMITDIGLSAHLCTLPYTPIFLSFRIVFCCSAMSKHRKSLFRYWSKTTETNVLFRIVPTLVSVPVSVISKLVSEDTLVGTGNPPSFPQEDKLIKILYSGSTHPNQGLSNTVYHS